MKLSFIFAILLFISIPAQAAIKLIVGDNVSGWNTSYTQTPFNADGVTYSTQALDKIKKLSPAGGVIRAMDMLQTVASPQSTPANRSTNNLSNLGVTWESLWQLGNITHNRLWVNIPQASAPNLDITNQTSVKNSYAYQMGFSAGKNVDPRLGFIKVEYSNELWNGGDQNQGTQNMFRARSSSYCTPGASDFQKLSEMAYGDWYDSLKAFKQGVKDSGSTLQVQGVAPGFIANHYYSIYGLNRLKTMRGSDPEYASILANSRIAVAPYAPGAPSDIGGITSSDTAASIISRTTTFVTNNYPTWMKNNYDDAKYYGLAGLDFYETMGLSTYDNSSGTNVLVDLNRTGPEARAFERWFFNYTADMSDGKLDGNSDPNSTLIVFGSAGIPYSEQYGQWSPTEFYNSPDSPKALGIYDFISASAGNVDPMGVPEPSSLLALVGCGFVLLVRKR